MKSQKRPPRLLSTLRSRSLPAVELLSLEYVYLQPDNRLGQHLNTGQRATGDLKQRRTHEAMAPNVLALQRKRRHRRHVLEFFASSCCNSQELPIT